MTDSIKAEKAIEPMEFSDLETETRNCEEHGEYESRMNKLGHLVIASKCPVCQAIRKKKEDEDKDRRAKQDKAEKIRSLFNNATIPRRFKEKSFDTYLAETDKEKYALKICKKYADNFETRLEAGGGLVLCGMPGTGKTHLAASIANHVIAEYMATVVFTSVISAMRRVKSTYSKDSLENESDAIKAFILPDLLILDEVGVQFGSNAEKIILFEIINSRYQDMKPTILISNLSIEDLKEYIGERVIDRMYEGGGAVIAFDWDSYRKKV